MNRNGHPGQLSLLCRWSAVFDDTRAYRYLLEARWDTRGPRCAFIMLNPSKADGVELDPTARVCLGFAERWGFGSLSIGNLFALVSTDPAELYRHPDPVGPENDARIIEAVTGASRVVVAWGSHGRLANRSAAVLALLREHGISPVAFAFTKNGEPTHPLRKRRDSPLVSLPIGAA